MKKTLYTITVLFFFHSLSAQTGVGIGTANPQAMLHIDTGAVLFSYNNPVVSNTPVAPPVSGAGTRFLWYPAKAAFRAGSIDNKQWNKDSIGIYSAAFGYNNQAKGYASFAAGDGSVANGTSSFAIGRNVIASGHYSHALGQETEAIGENSFAVNASTTALGNCSFAGGVLTEATGSTTFAFGYNLTAKTGVVFGEYNDRNDVPGNLSSPTDRVFQIGNGSILYGRNNAVTVLRNGNAGIGEVTPDAKLHITTNSGLSLPHLLLEESQNDYARLSFKNVTTNNVWTVAASPNVTNQSAQLNIFYQGYGDILKIYGNGNAILAGLLTENSDARLKTNITPLNNSLPLLQSISGYRYNWKDKARDTAVQIGLLAQEVQAVFPELVKEDEKGTLSVNYSGLVPVLIDAVKEQQKKIDALEKQVQWLMEKVSKQQ